MVEARLVLGPYFLELCYVNEWREEPNDIETFRLQIALFIRERGVPVVQRHDHDGLQAASRRVEARLWCR